MGQWTGAYDIPPQGSNIGGISVTLGLPLTLGLPIFHPAAVITSSASCVNGAPMGSGSSSSTDLSKLVLPSDYILPVFNSSDPPGTEDSILRVQLTAGVAASEVAAASLSPFSLPVGPPAPQIAISYQDVNGDGMLNIADDHVAASSILPALFPLSIFSKLASPTDDITAQSSPAIILQGLTLYKSLLDTVLWPGTAPASNLQTNTDVFVGLTPAVICLDPIAEASTDQGHGDAPWSRAPPRLRRERACSPTRRRTLDSPDEARRSMAQVRRRHGQAASPRGATR